MLWSCTCINIVTGLDMMQSSQICIYPPEFQPTWFSLYFFYPALMCWFLETQQCPSQVAGQIFCQGRHNPDLIFVFLLYCKCSDLLLLSLLANYFDEEISRSYNSNFYLPSTYTAAVTKHRR